MGAGGLVSHKICEGLRFDCVSSNELNCEVIEFGGPFSNPSYCFWIVEDIVEWEI
jgi:hypothetical protein